MNKSGFLTIIVFAIAATVLAYFSYHSGQRDGKDFSKEQYQAAIDSADRRIDTLEKEYFSLFLEKSKLAHNNDSLVKRDSALLVAYELGDRKLKAIRKKYDELLYIDKLNSDQIKNYFDSAFND